ncbi:PTS system, cellobiose-specific IIA component [Olsenella sp. KH3B4]|uniref:PTS lactose/cellobiose transporter subunit IIA n=1 Tax=Olsenella sp. KH3B4 TaxID=1855394 RepID=UPI0008B53448|nr:PTS lactose/cellobiose transporter subunit IIA [Olsenella sp. KH3B4]SET17082.1 PTS system, cellobiose-specific IIA component [Olsenella sp. KH3B4]
MDEHSVQTSFEIIAESGEARSKAYEALGYAKQGDFEKAKTTMAEAQEASNKAHAIQTDLITRAARGEELPLDILLIHSQDHLMTSILAIELIQELIDLYELRAKDKEGRA